MIKVFCVCSYYCVWQLVGHILKLKNETLAAKVLYLYCELSNAKGSRGVLRENIAITLSKEIKRTLSTRSNFEPRFFKSKEGRYLDLNRTEWEKKNIADAIYRLLKLRNY